MKHKILLIIPAVFSFLLAGCGAKPIPTSKIEYEDYNSKLDQITIANIDDKNGNEAYETNGNLEIALSATDSTGTFVSTEISYKYKLQNDLNTILLNENMSIKMEQKSSGKKDINTSHIQDSLSLTKVDDSTYSMYLKQSGKVESNGQLTSSTVSVRSTGKIYNPLAGSIIEKLRTNYSLYTIYLNETAKEFSARASEDNSACYSYGEQDNGQRFELDLNDLENGIKLSVE